MNRVFLILIAALSVSALKPLTAQQAAGAAPAAVSTAPVSSSSTGSGPRLQPEFRRYEASVSDSSTAARVSSRRDSDGGSFSVTFSSLALILVIVIIVLLVVK